MASDTVQMLVLLTPKPGNLDEVSINSTELEIITFYSVMPLDNSYLQRRSRAL